jgi:hypothetical protein
VRPGIERPLIAKLDRKRHSAEGHDIATFQGLADIDVIVTPRRRSAAYCGCCASSRTQPFMTSLSHPSSARFKFAKQGKTVAVATKARLILIKPLWRGVGH